MKLELFKDPICIGQLSSTEILQLAEFLNKEGKFRNLEGKKILDFGAGFSDLSNKLVENTNAEEVIALDKIYAEESTLSEVTKETLTYLRRIQSLFNDFNEENIENGFFDIRYTINSISERIQTVLAFEKQTLKVDKIKKYSHIDEVEDCSLDYIFVNFLFSYVKEKDVFLCELYSKLRKGGKIIITDIIGTPGMKNFTDSSLFQSDMEIRPFKRGNGVKGIITIEKDF